MINHKLYVDCDSCERPLTFMEVKRHRFAPHQSPGEWGTWEEAMNAATAAGWGRPGLTCPQCLKDEA